MAMRPAIILCLVLVRLGLECVRADDTWAYTVQLSASVRSSPPQITLSWPQDPYGVDSYTVYRKSRDASVWGRVAVLAGSATTYVDNNVAAGSSYEYQLVKDARLSYTGYGYIYAGIEAPLVDYRGKVILVVDSSHATALANELYRLQQDLVGDGWTVARIDVGRGDSPPGVRSAIQSIYRSDPAQVKAVFLFGHIPIFRCGNLDVDEHTPRPLPADVFYGEMDAIWGNPNFLPSDVDLMVGRVDLWNMPQAGRTETELLRNYLNKDHNWRHKLLNVPTRALIGNRAGDKDGEAPAASGFRNFEPFVGRGNVFLANEQENATEAQRWISMLAAGSYLWTYACGGGSYTSISYMGTHGQYREVWSIDIMANDPKAVFFMMYGSWLVEWDTPDNIMRAALATQTMGLTCSYAGGRPHWYYHHMGLGEPIGYSARVTQNNNGLYTNQVNRFQRGVHIALMGDPTLRMHPVAPPTAVNATSTPGGVRVTWNPASDDVIGYHVYRASSAIGPFSRRSDSLVNSPFTDTTGPGESWFYMVRAVTIEATPSGTYYNPSQGAFTASPVGGGGVPRPRMSVTLIRGAGSIVRMGWNSIPGARYQVQYTTNLSGMQWASLATVNATNTTTYWSEALNARGQRVYRIMVD